MARLAGDACVRPLEPPQSPLLYLMHSSPDSCHSELNVMATKNSSNSGTPHEPADEGDEVEIPSSGEAIVQTRDKPPRAPAGKKIHPRRPLLAVPDSDRSDED
jgi:hypothetical protein